MFILHEKKREKRKAQFHLSQLPDIFFQNQGTCSKISKLYDGISEPCR